MICANKSGAAIWIDDTFGFATGDRVWIGNESRFASEVLENYYIYFILNYLSMNIGEEINKDSAKKNIYLQMGFPTELTIHTAPGPQGEGLQGSGLSTHL